jgi:hypothetical protein
MEKTMNWIETNELACVVLGLDEDADDDTIEQEMADRYEISMESFNRFDGWRRVGFSRSGIDQRSGRRGRNKWIWLWEA